MKRIPTDLEIFEVIYKLYFDDYENWNKDQPGRPSKFYVPIDMQKIASRLKTERGIVFIRLYHHLEHKYGFIKPEAGRSPERVYFFKRENVGDVEKDKLGPVNYINFPYMVSILADLREAHRTSRNNFLAAGVSAVGAILSAIFAYLAIRKGP